MIKLLKKIWAYIRGLFQNPIEVFLPPVEEQQDVHHESEEYGYEGIGFNNV